MMKKIVKVLWCIYDEIKYGNELKKCELDNNGMETPIQTFTVNPDPKTPPPPPDEN